MKWLKYDFTNNFFKFSTYPFSGKKYEYLKVKTREIFGHIKVDIYFSARKYKRLEVKLGIHFWSFKNWTYNFSAGKYKGLKVKDGHTCLIIQKLEKNFFQGNLNV